MSDQLTTLITSRLSQMNQSRNLPSTEVSDAEEVDHTSPENIRSGTRRAARIGLWAIGLGFGGFLLWAAFAPLDEGVPSPAMVSIDTKRKAVQHQFGGVVKEVLVKEGSQVEAGQVLMRLDDAMATANFEAARQRYFGLRAMQARLLAEQAGRGAIEFQTDLLAAAKADPQIALHIQNQNQLFQARRLSLGSELQAMEEAVKGQDGMLRSYRSMLEGRREQRKLLLEEYQHTKDLVKDGYVPRNRQLEMERALAESGMGIADLEGNILRAQQTILELRQRMTSRRADFRKEVEGQLADVTREVQSEGSRMFAQQNELGRTEIKAPVSGQVVGLGIQTVGGVVTPGSRIMDVVPADEQLLLEARISPQMIDRIVIGQTVDIRFSAFSHTPSLVVQGEVKSVSRDLLSDPQTNIGYYLARVALTDLGNKELGKRELQPGMNAEVVFKTGERSLLTYLTGPLVRRVTAAMKEQ